jgi:hypothetical protein
MSAMAGDGVQTRYSALQLAEAIERARGDGRYFLVEALASLPGAEHEAALAQVLDTDLRPDERMWVLAELSRIRPATFLERYVTGGLRSRSINVQQMTIIALASMVDGDLSDELCEQVESWLRHRLANPRRGSTWATWETPAAALALLPSYGAEQIVALLDSLAPQFQPEERQRWSWVRRAGNDQNALAQELRAWTGDESADKLDPDPRDPTAEVSVDRAMKRLGYRPANPTSRVYDSLADVDAPETVFTVSQDQIAPSSEPPPER